MSFFKYWIIFSTDFYFKYPIIVAFSRRVGEVLSELPKDSEIGIRLEYKFYA